MLYKTSVVENAAVGTKLDVVTDQDSGINGSVTVLLIGQGAEDFKIDSTGTIRVNQSLDRETKSFYQLKIIAADKGLPPLNSTAELSITVDDINDNPPKFNQSLYTTTISENVPEGTIILTVVAEDADDAHTNKTKYSLEGSYAHFMINSTSGEIYPNSKSYVSVNTTYPFTVVATNQSVFGPAFTANATVVIKVLNENSITDVIFIWALIAIVVFTSVLVITVLLWILFSFCVW